MLERKNNSRVGLSPRGLFDRLVGGRVYNFLMGKWYPLAVCALVLMGHVFAIEVLTNSLILFSASLALVICQSVRPIIPVACTYLFQLSVENSPALPSYSDYCFSGWRLPLVLASFVCTAVALVYFAVKNKIFKGIHILKTPLLLPLLALSASFVLGGVLSPEWTPASLAFGALQAVAFLFFFLYFLFGKIHLVQNIKVVTIDFIRF